MLRFKFQLLPGRGFWKFIIPLYAFTTYSAPRTVAGKELRFLQRTETDIQMLISLPDNDIQIERAGEIYQRNKYNLLDLSPS
jgi:hypothetical protein